MNAPPHNRKIKSVKGGSSSTSTLSPNVAFSDYHLFRLLESNLEEKNEIISYIFQPKIYGRKTDN